MKKKSNIDVLNSQYNNKYIEWLIFMPIMMMLLLVPLIVRLNVLPLDESVAKFWTTNLQLDLFSYAKSVAIILITIFMILNMFFFLKKKTLKEDKYIKWMFITVGIFVFSLIMSTILSEHKQIAIWGAPERYEGLVMHLCYIVMFLYAYFFINTENDFRYVKYSILILASVMCIIGISQIIGKDILNSDFMMKLIIPSQYRDSVGKLNGNGSVYLTLQNSNYVGTYVALIIPFLLMFCISKYEHKYLRIYSGILAFITFFILVKSGSKAGLFAVMCILLLIPIIFYKAILNLKKTTIFITIAVIFLTGIGVNIVTGNAIAENLGKIMNDAKALLVKDKDYVHDPTYGLPIYDIELEKNRASVYTRGGIFNIDFKENGELEFRDSKEKLVNYKKNNNKSYEFSDFCERLYIVEYTNFDNTIKRVDVLCSALYYSIDWEKETGLFLVDRQNNRYDNENVEYIGFNGKEKLLSNRGYIWSRTLPLVINKAIFGYGSDTFISQFPQNDIPAKIYTYSTYDMITDKPHNIYLLYAINNGLVGLLSILTLWFGYIVFTVKNGLFKAKYINIELYKVACTLSIIGYMLTGILNDSVSVTAPIFWIILGTGFALNNMVGKDYER